eukprot:2739868-Pleurochrysis_carterae.AAC.2
MKLPYVPQRTCIKRHCHCTKKNLLCVILRNKLLFVCRWTSSQVGDVVTTVDGHVVTSIVDGMLQPRSAVTSAIDPTKQQLKVTVFRPI